MKKLLFLISLINSISIFAVAVTFRLDMRKQIVSGNGVHLAGSFNNWQTNQDQLSDSDGDGIYEITKAIFAGTYQYAYLNGNTIEDWERIGYIRSFTVTNSDIVLPVVCYNDDCTISSTSTTTNNSATISWTSNWPVDITFGDVVFANQTSNSLVLSNLVSCTTYQYKINFSGNPNSTTYNFSTTTDLISPANVPYKPLDNLQGIGQSSFCKIGWSNNTDFQFYQFDGIYYDITLGRSINAQYLSTTRSSATSRGINLVAGKTYYIQYRPSIYSNVSNISGSLKTSIGTNSNSNMQTVINSINFSQIPTYTFPANQPKISIPFIPPTSGVYYISLYSDDLPVFSNSHSVWLHNYEFQVTENVLSNSEVEIEKFVITPNPVKNIFEVKSKNKIDKVELYSIDGKLIRIFYNSKNDISFLAKGTYLLNVFSNNKNYFQKLIKE